MFKKAFFFVLVVIMIVLPSAVSAEPTYRPYLNGDSNYLNCGAHMGMQYYIVRDSINIESQDESECIISVDIVDVEAKSQRPPFKWHDEPVITKISTLYFLYDFDDKQMYVDTNDYFNNPTHQSAGKWRPLKYLPSWANGQLFELAGDLVFYVIFGNGFYRDADRFVDFNN